MRLTRTPFALLAVTILVACAGDASDARTEAERGGTVAAPTTDPAALRRTIDSLNTTLAASLTKKDAAGQAALYAPDGMVMLSNMPAWKGKAAIQENAQGAFEAMDFADVKFTTQDVEVSGDIAVETGTYSMTVGPKGQKGTADTGKYITVWKRQADGSWKIYRDISNSDAAPK